MAPCAGSATEGTYDLTRAMEGVNVAVPATAILIDAGETRVTLPYSDLRSREDVRVKVTIDAAVRLADPAALYANLMHGKESVAIDYLAEWLASLRRTWFRPK